MNRNLLIVLLLLFFSYPSAAGPAIPTRVGGSVTVDGVKLTLQGSAGYIFRVTGTNGKGFIPPAEDKDGLNKRGKYIIDIPIYDPASQSEGAKPDSKAVIHVFKNGVELKVVKPHGGEFKVGKGGTITPIDLVILSTTTGSTKEKNKR